MRQRNPHMAVRRSAAGLLFVSCETTSYWLLLPSSQGQCARRIPSSRLWGTLGRWPLLTKRRPSVGAERRRQR